MLLVATYVPGSIIGIAELFMQAGCAVRLFPLRRLELANTAILVLLYVTLQGF
jgi:hypothetical protein